MKFDFVIVGAGLTGCTIAEYLASHTNKNILIVEQRNHIAGNCYDFRDEHNIMVHKYGPHIFHTKRKKVWDYLSKFTEWEYYEHNVLGNIEGQLVPIPFNLVSLKKCFLGETANRIEKKLLDKFEYGTKIPILELRSYNDKDFEFLYNYVYKNVFEGYTKKQWGVELTELSKSVSERIPVFISHDCRYFQDQYQAMPRNGYTALCQNMLRHKNIHLLLSTDYFSIKSQLDCDKIICSGKIDTFFDYKYGYLPYRDLDFEFIYYDVDKYQPVAQVNYPNNNDFTRITEFIHFYKKSNAKGTVIAKEYSKEHDPNNNLAPFYPMPTAHSELIADKYFELAKSLNNVVFAGRLGDYKYYNMDDSVYRALEIAEFLVNC